MSTSTLEKIGDLFDDSLAFGRIPVFAVLMFGRAGSAAGRVMTVTTHG
jgi:hypothetical protein